MEISKGIEIVDLGLWLKKEKSLVIADLHIGYEGMLEHQGIFVPKFQLEDILERLRKSLEKVSPEKIIINGDLKHTFGKILKQEWRDTLRLFDFFSEKGLEITLIKGNHDVFLEPIARKKGLKIAEELSLGDIFICHGDKIKTTSAKTLIIAHEHPAIDLERGGKKERYKCFLKGKWKEKEIVVMPSFNPISDGSNVLTGGEFSPYLGNLSDFKAYVVGEKIYDFGKIKNLVPNLIP